jgi:diaminopimelate decarboxylase
VTDRSPTDDIDYRAIAEEFGTPYYVYRAEELERRFAEARRVVGGATRIYYSLKSNPNISVYAVLQGTGALAEVSSLAELRTVHRCGTEPEDILFLGPGKSLRELVACLTAGVRIVIESLQELDLVEAEAARLRTTCRALLRVNPAFRGKASGLTMGGAARQFGIDQEQLEQYLALGERAPHVKVEGLHAYMGARILSADAVVDNTRAILELAEAVAREQRFDLAFVDVGGGWGVPYFERESPLDLEALRAGMRPLLEGFADRNPAAVTAIELGRFLSAPAGTYVTQVRYTKTSVGQNFAIADGGTNHHMAAVGIGSFVRRNFPITLLDGEGGESSEWTVTGPLCTPNDTLVKSAVLPQLRRGDLLGIGMSGAYGASASPGRFLSHGYPAEVLVRDGCAELIAEPETTEHVLERQRLAAIARQPEVRRGPADTASLPSGPPPSHPLEVFS